MSNRPDSWSREEVDRTISTYFEMFKLQLKGEDFVKAKYHRSLVPRLDDRSENAVALKFCNVSAILIELGYPTIDGYSPQSHYQLLLRERVIEHLDGADELHDLLDGKARSISNVPLEGVPSFEEVREAPPEGSSGVVDDNSGSGGGLLETGQRINYVERERRNRDLGKKGEEFVIAIEKKRLRGKGRSDLADEIEWVAETRGDGLGYDVLSFEEDGGKRYVEVKTTKQDKKLPFYISAEEVQFSREAGARFYIYRVFGFGGQGPTSLYLLDGPVDETCHLSAESYQAAPK